jgi:hypothetical protein
MMGEPAGMVSGPETHSSGLVSWRRRRSGAAAVCRGGDEALVDGGGFRVVLQLRGNEKEVSHPSIAEEQARGFVNSFKLQLMVSRSEVDLRENTSSLKLVK